MPGTVFEFRFESDKALASLKKLEDGTRRTGQQMDKLDGGAKKIKSSLSGLLGPLKAVAAGFVSAFAVKSIIATADAMALLRGRLQNATGSAESAASAMSQLTRIANEQKTSIDATATVFTRLTTIMGDAGASQEQVLAITESLSAALRSFGTSSAEASSVMLQFSQAMGEGALRGDEFNAIAAAAPNILKAVAAELGVAQGAVRKLGSEGKLTGELIGNVLIKNLDKFKAEAAALPSTVSGAIQVLSNEWSQLVDTLNTTTGATDLIAAGFNKLSGAIASLNQFIKDTPGFFKSVSTAARLLGEVVIAALIGRVAQLTVAIGGSLIAALTRAGAAMGALRGVMALLGGPVGVIALVAFSVYELSDAFASQDARAKEASASAATHSAALQSLASQIRLAAGDSATLTGALYQQAQAHIAAAKAAIAQQQADIALAKDTLRMEVAMQDSEGSVTDLELALSGLGQSTIRAGENWYDFTEGADFAQSTMTDLASATLNVSEEMLNQANVITQAESTIAGLSDDIASLEEALDESAGAWSDVGEGTKAAIAPLKLAGTATDKATKATDKLAKKQKEAAIELKKFVSELENQAKTVALTTAEQEQLENVLKAMELAQKANIELTQDQIEAIKEWTVVSLGGVQAIEEFIQGLEEENKLLQREGVEREKLRAIMEAENIAREAGIELTEEQRQKIEELVTANAELGKSGETAAKVFGDAMKKLGDDIQSSLGDAFYNIFTGGVETFKDLVDTIKNLFLRMLADLIAFSLANPIRLAIGLGGVGGFGGSAAAAGALGDIGGLAGGGGGFSSFLNPISSFASPLIGSALIGGANILAGLGATGFATGLATTGSIIGTSGFLGGTGAVAAQAAGYAAAGSYTAALGAVAPYLAAIVAIAAAFGLFGGGKKSKGKLFTSFEQEGAILKESVDKHFELQAFEKTIDSIFNLTSTVLNAIGGKQAGAFVGLKQTEDGLTGLVGPPGDTGTFTLIGKVDPEDEQGVQDLFAQMAVAAIQQSDLSEVAAPLAAFFKQMTEESIEQLSAQDVSQLFDWVVNIADAAEIAGQKFPQITTLIENFVGGIDEAVGFTEALIAIGVAMDTTPFEDYQAIIEANSVSVTDAAHNAFMAAKELALGYDGSTGATIKLAQAVVAYKQAAILAAAAIAQAFDTVNAITLNSVEQIKLAGMTTEQQYAYFTTQAETLAASLDTLTDPAEIAKVVEQINKFSLAAFNLLSPEEQAKMGDAFIAFLEGVKLKADTKLTELGEGVEEDFKDLDATIDLSLLDAAAVSIKESSDTQSAAARRMESAASVMQGAGDQQLAAAARFNAAVAGIPSSITVNVVGSEIGGA